MFPGVISMGKFVNQLGTGREHFSYWSDLSEVVGLLGSLHGVAGGEGSIYYKIYVLVFLPDLTCSTLLLREVRGWRKG